MAVFLLHCSRIESRDTFWTYQGATMHILMTVNVAWNIWNFRRPLVEALAADGHRITVLALPNLIARGRGPARGVKRPAF